jgi:mitogen-activated protein kinase kinase
MSSYPSFVGWADCRDTQNSRLRFSGKAILHSEGVDFSSGQSFSLRLSDLLPLEELGKGNYGTVVHVIHRVTNAHMAMKQIKLELDNSKFMAIITELQVPSPLSPVPTLSLICVAVVGDAFGWVLMVGVA